MPQPWKNQGLGLIVLLVLVGLAMIYVPGWIADIIREGNDLGPIGKWIYFSTVGLGAALLLGLAGWGLWTLVIAKIRKERRREMRNRNPNELSPDQRRAELKENLESISDLRDEMADGDFRDTVDPMIDRIEEKLEGGNLEIIAFGTISSGKSSLLNALAGRDAFSTDVVGGTTVRRNKVEWPGNNKVQLIDTPGLGEVDGSVHQEIATHSAHDADIVLLVVDGPLRHSEFQLLELLAKMDKRVIICLNKEDWFTDADKAKLLQQITQQTKEIVQADDILSVRSRSTKRKRIRVLPNGNEIEEEVDVPLSIEPLARRMMQVIKKDGTDLLLANLLIQSRGLVEKARQEVEDSIDRQANQLVNRYMWASGSAGALTNPLPVPMVELAAGVAISTKMVMDLAKIYRQEVDLDVAVSLLGQLSKQFIGYLGVQMAAPVVAMAIGSMIKTVPGVGTVSGMLLNGIVMALVTRWIGNIFMVYFKNGMQEPEGGLAGLARREWDKVTDSAYLRKLVQEARQRYVERK
ncbi:DUF697 domain-containing protein [Bremerella sp. JC770]|uniref:YcjF family protein n=1 Tax=Bremerella sp. JC770 TaxID=3232137 RepID=UPI003459D5D0